MPPAPLSPAQSPPGPAQWPITVGPAGSLLGLLVPTDPYTVDRMVLDPVLLTTVGRLSGEDAATWAVESGRRMARDLRLPSDTGFFEAVALWTVLRLSGVDAVPSFLMRELVHTIHNGLSARIAIRDARDWLCQAMSGVCGSRVPSNHQLAVMSTVSRDVTDGMRTLACALAV